MSYFNSRKACRMATFIEDETGRMEKMTLAQMVKLYHTGVITKHVHCINILNMIFSW